MSMSSLSHFKMKLPPVGVVLGWHRHHGRPEGLRRAGSTRGGDFYMATSGAFPLATSGDFFMATDSNCLSLNGHYADLKSATMTGSGPATSLAGLPCSLLVTIPFTFHIQWSPGGQRSDLPATVNTNPWRDPWDST